MKVHKISIPSSVPAVQDSLAGGERFIRDEGGVTPWVQPSLERQNPGVVGIAKDLGEGARRHRPLWALCRCPCREPHIAQERGELPHGVFIGCVLLERPLDQGRAAFVHTDRVDESAVELDAGILVSQLRATDGSPCFALLSNFCFISSPL